MSRAFVKDADETFNELPDRPIRAVPAATTSPDSGFSGRDDANALGSTFLNLHPTRYRVVLSFLLLRKPSRPPSTRYRRHRLGLRKDKAMKLAMIAAFACSAVFTALLLSAALADPLPQPKPVGPGGSCPLGWALSGSYCVPSRGAQDAIPKPPNGTCPWGWLTSGSFCLRSGR
jgi:hypothetical protein